MGITECPCVECATECKTDTIECSNCKNWVHRTCAKLTESEFKEYSIRHLKYFCKCCAFVGPDYDADGGLKR